MSQHQQGENTAAVSNPLRQKWLGVLARASVAALKDNCSRIPDQFNYVYLRQPETGLTMVRGRAGGTGNPFNLGEMTVSRCSVRSDEGVIGHGYVCGRNKEHAELIAVFDALLQTPDHQETLMRDLIEPLQMEWQRKNHERSRKAAATKVEFYTMVRGED